MNVTNELVETIKAAGEDFEWYPTTEKMIAVVAKNITGEPDSILDIGAGDGRVLLQLAKRFKDAPKLYAIEKSSVLIQSQPEDVIPVGTDLFEQNLACLPVDYIFCNPPYSQFEQWVTCAVSSGYAKCAYLVIPRRWKESEQIAAALKGRGATARVIHSDDFHNAERRARAVVDIVEVRYPKNEDSYRDEAKDPFDIWFDENIDTFDHATDEDTSEYQQEQSDLAKIRHLESIADLVEAFNEEYSRMEENYKAIFKLDYALLKELGVSKENVREGIKKKMAGLKNKYWHALFEKLDAVTKRLSTDTKKRFLEKLTGRATVAFTSSNAYAIVLWAIKNANKYFDEQLVKLFRDLSTHEGVMNYKSNQRAWDKDGWRFNSGGDRDYVNSHYALDYRIVLDGYHGIELDYNGNERGTLREAGFALVDDVVAVFCNLGFSHDSVAPRKRGWSGGRWADFYSPEGSVLFQVKAFKNGNLHFRFMPDAIRALNVEAGRLLGWIRSREDIVAELGYLPDEANRLYGSSLRIGPSAVKLLTA